MMVMIGLVIHPAVFNAWSRGIHLLDFSLVAALRNLSCMMFSEVGAMGGWLFVEVWRLHRMLGLYHVVQV